MSWLINQFNSLAQDVLQDIPADDADHDGDNDPSADPENDEGDRRAAAAAKWQALQRSKQEAESRADMAEEQIQTMSTQYRKLLVEKDDEVNRLQALVDQLKTHIAAEMTTPGTAQSNAGLQAAPATAATADGVQVNGHADSQRWAAEDKHQEAMAELQTSYERRIQELQARLEAAKNRVSGQSSPVTTAPADWQMQLEALASELDACQQTLVQERQRIKQLTFERDQAQKEKDAAEATRDKSLNKVAAEVQTTERINGSLTTNLNQVEHEHSSSGSQSSNDLQEAAQRCQELEDTVSLLQQRCQENVATIADLRRELETALNNKATEPAPSISGFELESAQERVRGLERDLAASVEREQQLQAQRQQLQLQSQQLQRALEAASQQLNDRRDGEVQTVETPHEAPLQQTSGGDLEEKLHASQRDVEAAVTRLHNVEAELTQTQEKLAVAEDRCRTVEAQARQATERAAAADSRQRRLQEELEAVQLDNDSLREQVTTVERRCQEENQSLSRQLQQALEAQTQTAAPSSPTKAAKLESLGTEVAMLKADVADFETEQSALNAERRQLLEERDQLRAQMAELEKRAELAEAAALQAHHAAAEAAATALVDSAEALALQEALAERDKLKSQLEKLQQHMLTQEEKQTEDSLRADERLSALQAQLVEQGEKSKRETAALEGRIVHGKHRLAAVEQQLAQVTAERESLRSQVEDLQQRHDQLQVNLSNLEAVLASFEDEKNRDVTNAVADLELQLQTARQECEQLRAKASTLEQRVAEQERTVKEAKETATKAHLDQGLVQSMSAEIHRLRDQLSSTQARLTSAATSADETLVDNTLLRNTVKRYFMEKDRARQREVLQLLATLCRFGEQELIRVGLKKQSFLSSWFGGSGSASDTQASSSAAAASGSAEAGAEDNSNFSSLFVNFLLEQSHKTDENFSAEPTLSPVATSTKSSAAASRSNNVEVVVPQRAMGPARRPSPAATMNAVPATAASTARLPPASVHGGAPKTTAAASVPSGKSAPEAQTLELAARAAGDKSTAMAAKATPSTTPVPAPPPPPVGIELDLDLPEGAGLLDRFYKR